jgi:imidazolonepropionase-like amidohydrolase
MLFMPVEGKQGGIVNNSYIMVQRNISILVLAVVSVIAPSPSAADMYLKAAALVDTERGRLIQNPALVISGNRIVKVGTHSTLEVPEGAEIVDMGEQTLLPGLMDMHVHLASAPKDVPFLESMLQSIPRKTLNVVTHAEATLLAGFTSVRDVGSPCWSTNLGNRTIVGCYRWTLRQ